MLLIVGATAFNFPPTLHSLALFIASSTFLQLFTLWLSSLHPGCMWYQLPSNSSLSGSLRCTLVVWPQLSSNSSLSVWLSSLHPGCMWHQLSSNSPLSGSLHCTLVVCGINFPPTFQSLALFIALSLHTASENIYPLARVRWHHVDYLFRVAIFTLSQECSGITWTISSESQYFTISKVLSPW